jgi:uncharacterized protein
MYATSIPYLLQNLKALTQVLKKAEAHCDARKFDKSVVLATRIYPDMFPLLRQVLLVTDFTKGAAARLAGVAVPSYADEEKTFEEIYARIAKTEAFVSSLDAKSFEGAEERQVTLKIGGKDMTLSGATYFNGFVLPNIYFHATTAYNILRGMGIELSKNDFMGR